MISFSCTKSEKTSNKTSNLPTQPRTINFPHSAKHYHLHPSPAMTITFPRLTSHNQLTLLGLAPSPSPTRPRTINHIFPRLASHHQPLLPLLGLAPSFSPTRPRTITFPHSSLHHRLPPLSLALSPSPTQPRTIAFPTRPCTTPTCPCTINSPFPSSQTYTNLSPPPPAYLAIYISLRRNQLPRSLSAATNLPHSLGLFKIKSK